jgi:hypothetical protein
MDHQHSACRYLSKGSALWPACQIQRRVKEEIVNLLLLCILTRVDLGAAKSFFVYFYFFVNAHKELGMQPWPASHLRKTNPLRPRGRSLEGQPTLFGQPIKLI